MWTYLSIVNATTFLVYACDKAVAGRGIRRIPESVLHLCSAIGGSVGAFLAMHLLRHKTRKVKFQVIFWLIVAVQGVVSCTPKMSPF